MRTNGNERQCKLFTFGIAVAVAMLLTACDTSSLQSGIEGTGIADQSPAAVSRGPIDSVDGFDVTVNAVTWSGENAEILIDGAAGSIVDLKPGMLATVKGERTAPARGKATAIETQIIVRGPILEIDAAKYRLNVLGQAIVGDRSTKLDVPGGSLAALSVGQVVAVSGFVNANNEVRATLVATRAGAAEWLVNGAVTGVNADVQRFAINGLQVTYTAGLLAGLPSGTIEIGQTVTVLGRSLTSDGALIARNIVAYDPSLAATDAETVLSGIVARIEGENIFVSGQRIVLLPGVPITEGLAPGSYVRVTGRVFGGILYASDVLVLGSGHTYSYVVGYVEAVNVAARTLTMLGVEFRVSETLIHNSLSLDRVAVGDRVQVFAYANGFITQMYSGNGYPYAAERLVLIEGEFLDLSPPVQFTLRGVADWVVQVTATTGFSYYWLDWGDGDCYARTVSADGFFELAAQPKPPGVTTVWAWGRFEGGIFLANSTGICFPGSP